MSRGGSELQAGPSIVTKTNTHRRSAPSDNENEEVRSTKSLKKRKTDERDTASPCAAESSKKKRRKKRRKISVTGPLRPVRSLAMQLMGNPGSTKSAKGKERVAEPHVPVDEVKDVVVDQSSETQSLQEQLEKAQKMLDVHKSFVSTIRASLTCQICLEPMFRPYALSPCGHTACYSCLVSWFRARPSHIPMPPPDHLAQNFDRESPEMLALGAPMLIRKDKTCPHCRASVKEAPIEAWAVKDIVSAAFAKDGGLAAELFPGHAPSHPGSDTGNGDPWHGIFKRDRGRWGWYEDGNGNGNGERNGEAAVSAVDERGTRGFYDDEDDTYRCTECLHEIWNGLCSSCGRVYPGHPRDGADDDDADSFGGDPDFDDMSNGEWMDHLDHLEGAVEAFWDHQAFNEMLEQNWRQDDDGYESSFIDDDDEPGRGGAHIEEASSDEGGDEEEYVPARSNYHVNGDIDEEEAEGEDEEENEGESEGEGEGEEVEHGDPRLRIRAFFRSSRHLIMSDEESSEYESEPEGPRPRYSPRHEIPNDDEEEEEYVDSDSDEGLRNFDRIHEIPRRMTRRLDSDSDEEEFD